MNSNGPSNSIKDGQFLDLLSNYHTFSNYFPWRKLYLANYQKRGVYLIKRNRILSEKLVVTQLWESLALYGARVH